MRTRLWVALCVSSLIPLRSQGPAGADVEGIPGQIEVRTVENRCGTFIQLKAADGRHPLVFILQYKEKAKFLPDWTGNGTLYLSRGLVALAGEDGTRKMAKFPDAPVPASLVRFSMDNFEIVGIARYGESSPLSESQVLNLRTYGFCGPASHAPDSRQAAAPLQLEGFGGMACTSGGDGSTSCSPGGGGCSVTCGTGYYACCNADSNQCRCRKAEP
ncbi:MAG: hypothetical protein ACPL7M_05720 [Bryobacteraceae bacterium]